MKITASSHSLAPLQPVLAELGIPLRDLARAAGLSRSTVGRLSAKGQLPTRRASEVRQQVVAYLKSRGASMAQLRDLVLPPAKKLAPTCLQHAEADPPVAPDPTETQEEEPMLIRNETLTPVAKRHFQMARNPFVDDIQSRADVFASQHARYVRAALLDAGTHHGFIAIVGESGSGKSTLREDLEERIREERRPMVLIKPYAREPNKTDRRPIRPSHIEAALFRALGPNVPRKSNPDDRTAQIHELLKSSRQAGYTHLLMIEEAHRMPVDTLKQLKNFMEMKDGLRRLLGVALFGQPELANLLDERNPEVREIVQRCEQIKMEPLDGDLEGYLTHKLERAGVKLADVLEADALDAIRARLISLPRGGRATDAVSMCFPLVVNNLVCRAFNAAAAVGYPKVDAQVIAGC
ncbi:MAG: AAA family ATPase [Ramlibacter sp.]|nr:AAA family ATPase [Ramlibacter sp.]MCW5650522.1 AAA family ATPase [Ramlibacter sp.]